MFHVEPNMIDLNEFEKGFLLGLLAREGHFGSDKNQAHITLKIHVKRKKLFDWINEKIPGSKLYGPYNHDGRRYYQFIFLTTIQHKE